MIDAAFRLRAEAALADVERREGVRVLFGIESGSRAWGFASQDSDYDVRFIYLRPLDGYLSVTPRHDMIGPPVDGLLDLGGWDLRKAVGLMVRSNAVALEWLASPVVYRREPGAVADLAILAHRAAHLPALEHHYDRLARAAWPPEADGAIWLKSYFHALRPALALLWLRQHGTPPPMDLPALLSAGVAPPAVAARIEALRQQKGGGHRGWPDAAPAGAGRFPRRRAGGAGTTAGAVGPSAGVRDGRPAVPPAAWAMMGDMIAGMRHGPAGVSCRAGPTPLA